MDASRVEVGVEYREIPGFPGYRVGSDGTVWTRNDRAGWLLPAGQWRRLAARTDADGHKRLALRNGESRHGRSCYVHRLVLEAFVGPCPPGMQACHNDGNPANNVVSNLRWDTAAANVSDAFRHGTRSKRADGLEGDIVRDYVGGKLSVKDMVAKYRLSYGSLYRVIHAARRSTPGLVMRR